MILGRWRRCVSLVAVTALQSSKSVSLKKKTRRSTRWSTRRQYGLHAYSGQRHFKFVFVVAYWKTPTNNASSVMSQASAYQIVCPVDEMEISLGAIRRICVWRVCRLTLWIITDPLLQWLLPNDCYAAVQVMHKDRGWNYTNIAYYHHQNLTQAFYVNSSKWKKIQLPTFPRKKKERKSQTLAIDENRYPKLAEGGSHQVYLEKRVNFVLVLAVDVSFLEHRKFGNKTFPRPNILQAIENFCGVGSRLLMAKLVTRKGQHLKATHFPVLSPKTLG